MNPSDKSLTSDFDYLKILTDGTATITTTTISDPDFYFPTDPFGGFGFGEQGIAAVTHNLGSIPIVRAFIQVGSRWYSSYYQTITTSGGFSSFHLLDPNLLMMIDINQVKLCVNASSHQSNIQVYYRVYRPGTAAVDSDDRIDKIFFKDATQTASLGAAPDSADPLSNEVAFAHGQGEDVLWTFQFSDDGQNWYDDGNFIYGPPDTGSGPPGGPYSNYYYMRAYASGDINNFYVRFEHNYPTTKLFHFRYALDYKV